MGSLKRNLEVNQGYENQFKLRNNHEACGMRDKNCTHAKMTGTTAREVWTCQDVPSLCDMNMLYIYGHAKIVASCQYRAVQHTSIN